MCNSNSKRCNSCILLAPGEYVVHRHTCRQSTHTHGGNKKFSKLPVRVGENTSSAVRLHSLDSCRGWRAPAACALAPTPHESLHLEGVTDTCLQYEHHYELWSADKVSRPFVGLRRTLSITTVLHHWRWASRSETRDWVSTWWQGFSFIKDYAKHDFTVEYFCTRWRKQPFSKKVKVSGPSFCAFALREGKLEREAAAAFLV